MTQVVEVGFRFVYDFYYRTRHAALEQSFYRIDFLDWVKAGVAYNALSAENVNRRVSYFGDLYYRLSGTRGKLDGKVLEDAVSNFYDDIFQLYQDHLSAQLKSKVRGKQSGDLSPQDLVIIPSFDKVDIVQNYLERKTVKLDSYMANNENAMQKELTTAYISKDSMMYHAISLMYDYGHCPVDTAVILEVLF